MTDLLLLWVRYLWWPWYIESLRRLITKYLFLSFKCFYRVTYFYCCSGILYWPIWETRYHLNHTYLVLVYIWLYRLEIRLFYLSFLMHKIHLFRCLHSTHVPNAVYEFFHFLCSFFHRRSLGRCDQDYGLYFIPYSDISPLPIMALVLSVNVKLYRCENSGVLRHHFKTWFLNTPSYFLETLRS